MCLFFFFICFSLCTFEELCRILMRLIGLEPIASISWQRLFFFLYRNWPLNKVHFFNNSLFICHVHSRMGMSWKGSDKLVHSPDEAQWQLQTSGLKMRHVSSFWGFLNIVHIHGRTKSRTCITNGTESYPRHIRLLMGFVLFGSTTH